MGRGPTGHSQPQAENSQNKKAEPDSIRKTRTMTMTKKIKKCRTRSEIATTHPRETRYTPIRTDPEKDVIQIHTGGKIPQGEEVNIKMRRSDRNTNKPKDTVVYPLQKNLG